MLGLVHAIPVPSQIPNSSTSKVSPVSDPETSRVKDTYAVLAGATPLATQVFQEVERACVWLGKDSWVPDESKKIKYN